MPGKFPVHTPDAIDVANMCSALGNDFRLFARWEMFVDNDLYTVICRVYSAASWGEGKPEWVALQRRPIKSHPDAVVMAYQTALDCWHQADRGGLLQGKQDIAYGWGGRPERPRRTS